MLALPAAAGRPKHLGLINARPVWSPNGKWIAFQSNTGPRPYGTEIWVMEANGSARHDLGEGGGFATWSPDSKRIAFSNGPAIVVVRRDGTQKHEFLGGTNPDWSSRNEIAYEDVGRIHVVRPDGKKDRLLVSNATAPHWSPNGTRLAFIRDGDIWEVDRLGSDLRRMTTLAAPNVMHELTWSPDGSAIAFTIKKATRSPSQPFELWRIDSDGANPTLLVHYEFPTSRLAAPMWSPSSRSIAFYGDLYVRPRRFHDIFRISKAGGSAKNVTRSPRRNEYDPDWGKTGRIAFTDRGGNINTIGNDGRGLRNLTRHR